MEVGHDLQDGQEKESPLAVRDAGLVVAQAKVDETNENTEDNGLAGARLEGERVADGDNPGTLGELQQLGEGSGSLDRLDLLFLSHQAGGRVILLEERKGGEGAEEKTNSGGKTHNGGRLGKRGDDLVRPFNVLWGGSLEKLHVEVGWVGVGGTRVADVGEKLEARLSWSIVGKTALDEQVESVKTAEDLRGGLVNGADDRGAGLSQLFQDVNKRQRREAVQTGGGLVQEEKAWTGDELVANRRTLALPTRKPANEGTPDLGVSTTRSFLVSTGMSLRNGQGGVRVVVSDWGVRIEG